MNSKAIKEILIKYLNLEKVYVTVDFNHCKIIAVDKIFIGKSKLEQHKIIYFPLIKYITDNKIHAVSIQAFSPKDWDKYNKLYDHV